MILIPYSGEPELFVNKGPVKKYHNFEYHSVQSGNKQIILLSPLEEPTKLFLCVESNKESAYTLQVRYREEMIPLELEFQETIYLEKDKPVFFYVYDYIFKSSDLDLSLTLSSMKPG